MKSLLTILILVFVSVGRTESPEVLSESPVVAPIQWKTPGPRTLSTVCFLPDDETIPDFELELNGKSAAEYKKILNDKMNSYNYDEIPKKCAKKPRPVTDELAKEAKKALTKLPENEFATDFGSRPCGLSSLEIKLIRYYTGTGYQWLNQYLRNKIKDRAKCERIAAVAETINGALSKIAPYKGFVRRGFELPVSLSKTYTVGQIIRESAFLSTSTAEGFIRPYRALIYSKTCVNVDPISTASGEREVLCPAGSEFYIHYRMKAQDSSGFGGETWLLMEQIK